MRARLGDALDADAWARVFREAAALGAVHVGLTGGEPSARRDLEACDKMRRIAEAERDAAAALSKMEKKLYADGPEDNSAKQLNAFAEKYSGTKAGDRARHLAARVE